jgi:hypothetical protein
MSAWTTDERYLRPEVQRARQRRMLAGENYLIARAHGRKIAAARAWIAAKFWRGYESAAVRSS